MRALTRGVTLIELLVVIVLLGATAVFAGVAVHRTARAAHDAARVAAVRRSILTMQTLLRHDFGSALDGDVTTLSPTAVQYRRPVGGGAGCAGGPMSIIVPDSVWTGARLPAAGRDSAFLLVDTDGTWASADVVGVSNSGCGGHPAIEITLDRAVVHPVVLVYEPVRLAAYSSGGADWLGLAPAGPGTIQPFAGPVLHGGAPWSVTPFTFAATFTFAGAAAASTFVVTLPPP